MKIEVWSDIVCPWCYIGKRRLERALDGIDDEVEIVWRSFELDPGAPKRPRLPLDEALATKYGMSVDRAREMMAQMTKTAAEEGLEFDFSSAQSGNTFDAHRLIHFAAEQGLQGEMKERLLRAYMTEGRPIADRDDLTKIAEELGFESQAVTTMFESVAFSQDVRDDESKAHEIGVRGVPFFLIDEELAISGAQPVEILREKIESKTGDVTT